MKLLASYHGGKRLRRVFARCAGDGRFDRGDVLCEILDKNQGQVLFLLHRILRFGSRLPVPAHVYGVQYGIRTTGLFPATPLLRDHTGWHSGQEPQHYSENIVSAQLAPVSRSVYSPFSHENLGTGCGERKVLSDYRAFCQSRSHDLPSEYRFRCCRLAE